MKNVAALFFIVIICLVSFTWLSSYAVPVTISRTTLQAKSGVLTYMYFVSSSSLGSQTPNTNVATNTPSNSGSYSIPRGGYAYLWSPQFPEATTISAGNWIVDFWISVNRASSPVVSLYIVDSTGSIVSTLVNAATGPPINPYVKTEVFIPFSLGQFNIPANGYIEVQIKPAASSRSGTLYWGVGQFTNFQVPLVILS